MGLFLHFSDRIDPLLLDDVEWGEADVRMLPRPQRPGRAEDPMVTDANRKMPRFRSIKWVCFCAFAD